MIIVRKKNLQIFYNLTNRNKAGEMWQRIVEENCIESFESLVYLLNAKLIRFSLIYIDSKEIAEGIIAEVFVTCWNNRKHLYNIKDIVIYLYKSVRSLTLHYSKMASQITPQLVYRKPELIWTHGKCTMTQERDTSCKEWFNRIIISLPIENRLIFKLLKDHGFNYMDIAEILEIPLEAVKRIFLDVIQSLFKTDTDDGLISCQTDAKPSMLYAV